MNHKCEDFDLLFLSSKEEMRKGISSGRTLLVSLYKAYLSWFHVYRGRAKSKTAIILLPVLVAEQLGLLVLLTVCSKNSTASHSNVSGGTKLVCHACTSSSKIFLFSVKFLN